MMQQDQTIAERDDLIRDLRNEIARLEQLNAQNGAESGELAQQLNSAQKMLAEAEERIR